MGYIGAGPTRFNTADELTVTGDAEFNGNATFGDNDKAVFGAGSDLQIYHDGSQSYITDTGTGSLRVRAEDFILQNADGSNAFLYADAPAGAVLLYHNGNQKFQTTSSGIDVTGTVTADDNIVLSGASSPAITITDTTNTAVSVLKAGNVQGITGTTSNHDFFIRSNDTNRIGVAAAGDVSLYDSTGVTQGFFWDASTQRLGLGTTSPVADLTINKNADAKIQILSSNAGTGRIVFGDQADQSRGDIKYDHTNEALTFSTNNMVEAVRIDSSGNVGIGVTSTGGGKLAIGGTGTSAAYHYMSNAAGNGYVGISSSTGGAIMIGDSANSLVLGTGTVTPLHFGTNNNVRATIDTSGNLLVGKTTTTESDSGLELRGVGLLKINRDNGVAMSLRRDTGAGHLVELKKDASDIGFFGASSNTRLYVSGPNAGGILFDQYGATNGAPLPCTSTGAKADNLHDFGVSDARWDDIYATNGTIQTSDQNEKQQIASLTDAEIAAAKAISQLFKTFKWNDKVAAKGDAARRHTGVVAQDVEAAMTAAGLDAGDYAFFISTTWWEHSVDVPAVAEETDEDGNVTVEAQEAYTRIDTYRTAEEAPEGATEHNRKGIRYPELLSFVGAATEQRLANIETRLAALEAN